MTPKRRDITTAVGYIRVSTQGQGASGLGMEAQRSAIEATCAARGWELLRIEEDVASAKTTNGRPGLDAALERVESGEAEALVVARLDRLARSVIDGAAIIDRANKGDWALVVVDLGLDTSTAQGRFGATVLLAAAELERNLISERTRAARAAALAAGRPVGGRPKGKYEIPDDVRARIVRERDEGRSYRNIAAGLDADGVKPARAARWSAEAVRQVVLATP
jgi:DNA invertase Pin-like site-specific DNA recombinase